MVEGKNWYSKSSVIWLPYACCDTVSMWERARAHTRAHTHQIKKGKKDCKIRFFKFFVHETNYEHLTRNTGEKNVAEGPGRHQTVATSLWEQGRPACCGDRWCTADRWQEAGGSIKQSKHFRFHLPSILTKKPKPVNLASLSAQVWDWAGQAELLSTQRHLPRSSSSKVRISFGLNFTSWDRVL